MRATTVRFHIPIASYSDIAMETLMLKCQPIMEKTYRIKIELLLILLQEFIKHGDILHRHKDRFSCEISTTMNLGGDSLAYLFRSYWK